MRFKNPDRNIQKPTEKLRDFFVRVNTHRKIAIILSVFSKLIEKLYTRKKNTKPLNLSPDAAAHPYPKRVAHTRPRPPLQKILLFMTNSLMTGPIFVM